MLLRFDLIEKIFFAFLASSEESLDVLLTYINILGWHCVIQNLCENWKNEDIVNFVFFRGIPGRERGSYVLRCVSLETLETLEILNLRRSLSEKRATSSSSSRIQNLGLVCRTKEVSENSYMLGFESVVNCAKHKENLDGITQVSNSDPDSSNKDAWTINVVKKLQEFNDGRHVVCVRTLRLMRSEDIESNPGPTHGETGRIENTGSVVTYNVRGLKDEGKMRHLLNYCHKGADSTKLDSFYLFQETYIETPGKIPYLWRGNYYLTPGEGNSGGCLTLMSNHISVVSSRVIEKRAHILACQKIGENEVSYIIANVYAPNPNLREKVLFFEKLFEHIQEFELLYGCTNIIVGGDFNLTFKNSEVRNRNRTVQEKRVAQGVSQLAEETCLRDIWQNKSEFTWRRPNTDSFSCLDHIFYNSEVVDQTLAKTNWALSFSDHAAVEASFVLKTAEPVARTRIARLDPSLIKTAENKIDLENRFNELWRMAEAEWDPHTKLEYAKMCVRTVGETMQAERKRREVSEEEELNDELNLAIKGLEREGRDMRDRAILIDYVEELRSRKEAMIDRKGERLAEKLGSKWYNEGEKSTRYFLRLLNRQAPNKFVELIDAQGNVLKKGVEIEEEIVNFYKNLYENYDKSTLGDVNETDFFSKVTPIPGHEAAEVAQPITLDDLTKTLHTCKDSAPGPDGIPYSFLAALWKTFGQLICDAWNHSLRTGKLCPSHKNSYLRLIPTLGKDLKSLNNWRPITLSNCDHKLITKSYSNRMATKLSGVLGERQTAYLKGRLINDNIRSIATSIHLANLEEEDIDGLVVSLDAKKAFDSVEHSYIEKCFEHFGLETFIPIFRVLYSELRSDIMVNGKVVSGYNIRRGVKQGDALSCIIFIMCMEPLIRNIEENDAIEKIVTVRLEAVLPKAYAYADDLTCIIKNTQRGIQAVFDEYSKLSRLAGLVLNADKTEVLRFASTLRGQIFQAQILNVNYLGRNYPIETLEETKINGIFFQQDEAKMRTRNVEHFRKKIEDQMSRWTRRSLTILGKILIVKTFGVSQIIYLMQSLTLENVHFKLLNEVLYRFIWNKNFRAPKAPERVKRDILNLPIKLGGFGMLDIKELDNGLKLRALGRIITSEHPCLSLLRNKIDFGEFFFPTFDKTLDNFVAQGVELLRQDRQALLREESIRSNVAYVSAVRACRIRDLIKPVHRNNLRIFMLNRAGKTRIGHLSVGEFHGIRDTLIDGSLRDLINYVIPLRVPAYNEGIKTCYYIRNRWVELGKLTSKQLRDSRSDMLQLCVYKCGLVVTPNEGRGWLMNLKGLTSTAHKNAILRFMHGDVYSKDRLFRFGLNDSPVCDYCDEIETVNHRIYECRAAKNLWKELARVTSQDSNQIEVDYVAGAFNGCTMGYLTIHAELIGRLIRNINREEINVPTFIRSMISALAKREKLGRIKQELEALL